MMCACINDVLSQHALRKKNNKQRYAWAVLMRRSTEAGASSAAVNLDTPVRYAEVYENYV